MMKRVGKGVSALLMGMVLGCGGSAQEQMSTPSIKGEAIDEAVRAQIQASCKGTHSNHGHCISCVDEAADALLAAGTITGRQKGQIVSSFAQNECRTQCIPTSCILEGAECGSISDLCGQELACGSCPDGLSCEDKVCIPTTGPNRVVCFCLDGTVQTTCAALDCSSSFERAQVCAPLCADHLRLDGAGCGENECVSP